MNKIELRYPDSEVYQTTTKDLVENVESGTVLYQLAGGGGGYGDPRLRDAAKVAREVRNGIISIQQARENYGVVVDPETFAVDSEATKKMRNK